MGQTQPCRGLGALAKCCCYPAEDGEHPRMGDREPKVREESRGASWPAHSEALVISSWRVRPAKDQAGPSSRRRRTNQDRCAHPRSAPGWETWDLDRSNQNVGVDFLTESWQVPVGEPQSWLRGSGTKPRYLQGRIRHLLKYNSSVLVGPSWRQSDRPGVGWTTHLSFPETSPGFHC